MMSRETSWKLGGTLGGSGIREALHLGVNLFAQVRPDTLIHFEENFDDVGIELPSRPEFDLVTSCRQRLCRAIRPVRSNGIERIRHGEHSRSQRNLLALQPARITGAVILLLVSVDDLRGLAEERNFFQDFVAVETVLLHDQ